MPNREGGYHKIIDAGAYVGLSALYFANRFSAATIVALEPHGQNYTLLRHNTKHCPRIVPIRAALWIQKGRSTICDRGTGDWGFALSPVFAGTGTNLGDVECLSVPDIMERFSWREVDLLKLDVEGAEKQILENAHDWIDKVQVIVAELHDRIVPGCLEAWQKATEKFAWKSYRNGLFIAAQHGR
ncbi:MAG: FkbM family methyltransferase [Armatimonadota bacterium]